MDNLAHIVELLEEAANLIEGEEDIVLDIYDIIDDLYSRQAPH